MQPAPPGTGSAPEKPDASQSEPDSSQTEPEAAPSQAEISPERAALMAQLPPMVPDSNGTYPTIPGDIYDELVIQSDQPAGRSPPWISWTASRKIPSAPG